MKKNKLISIVLIFFGLFLYYPVRLCQRHCQGKKDQTKEMSFWLKKKNPLAMPPDFDKLPTPGNKEINPETFTDNKEVKELLNIGETENNSVSQDGSSSDIESSILKKIQ